MRYFIENLLSLALKKDDTPLDCLTYPGKLRPPIEIAHITPFRAPANNDL
jgi:hypothetical protein